MTVSGSAARPETTLLLLRVIRGYLSGKEQAMFKTAIRLQNDMVMVFDEEGEQVSGYQGQYGDVKRHILQDAMPRTVFAHWFDYAAEQQIVPRERW